MTRSPHEPWQRFLENPTRRELLRVGGFGVTPPCDSRGAKAPVALDGKVEVGGVVREVQIDADVHGIGRTPLVIGCEEHGREPHGFDLDAANRRA